MFLYHINETNRANSSIGLLDSRQTFSHAKIEFGLRIAFRIVFTTTHHENNEVLRNMILVIKFVQHVEFIAKIGF